ncbi:MAG: glyoxalase [Planctomycetes bacterium]|nr:glyoxalase [Planctomycetota bacterium]
MHGLRHVALLVGDVDRSVAFYRDVFGMKEEWRPDPDSAYLTGGSDNLALHRGHVEPGKNLDHIGFVVPNPDDVDAWEAHLRALGHSPEAASRTHRDGARSFYVQDPDGHTIQVLFHPPIS